MIGSIEWATTDRLVPYPDAVTIMERRAAAIAAKSAPELVWLLEHPPCITSGASAKPHDLLRPDQLPVFETGRGGQFTYHGPGQRIAYVILDVRRRADGDVRAFVQKLERWIIAALARLGVIGETRAGRVGIWVPGANGSSGESKIAAIGLRVRHGVSFHGLSLNVAPNLDHFAAIVPCGIRDHGVTSLQALGIQAPMADVDLALRLAFETEFEQTMNGTAPANGKDGANSQTALLMNDGANHQP